MNQPKTKRRRSALSRWLDQQVLLITTDITRRRTEADIKAFNAVYSKAFKKNRERTMTGDLNAFLVETRDKMLDHTKDQIRILEKKLGIRKEEQT